MISFLIGDVLFTDAESICLFANGIGWNINVADPLSYVEGSQYSLYCYTHYTQDQSSLWGVSSLEELMMLRKLVSVPGVGPRTATLLLSLKGVAQIKKSIEEGDLPSLKVKGLGEKTLQKIILELRGKIDLTVRTKRSYGTRVNDIIEALVKMGYTKLEIDNFIASKPAAYMEETDSAQIINDFLKHK